MDGQTFPDVTGTPLSTADPRVDQPVGGSPDANTAQVAQDTAAPQTTEVTPPSSPSQPPSNGVDYEAAFNALAPRYQQYEQAFNELRQLQEAAQRQAAEQQIRQAAQSRIDMAYQMARDMEPEQALDYVRRVEDQERAGAYAQIQSIQQQAQRQVYEAVSHVAAPLYAQNLARQMGLPQEYAERLAMIPPQQMDTYAPVLKREYDNAQAQDRRYQELLQRFDQLQRSQQAAAINQSGIGNVSSTTGVPVSREAGEFVPGSREQLMSKIGHWIR